MWKTNFPQWLSFFSFGKKTKEKETETVAHRLGSLSVNQRRFRENATFGKFQDDRRGNFHAFVQLWAATNGSVSCPGDNFEPRTMDNGYQLTLVFMDDAKRAQFMKDASRDVPYVRMTVGNDSDLLFTSIGNRFLVVDIPFQDPDPFLHTILLVCFIFMLLVIIFLLLATIRPQHYEWIIYPIVRYLPYFKHE
jgi:hypothetical protein